MLGVRQSIVEPGSVAKRMLKLVGEAEIGKPILGVLDPVRDGAVL